EHDVIRLQCRAAPHRQWPRLRRKRHEGALRRQMEIGCTRKVLLAAQHLEMVQVGPGEAGVEITTARDDELDLCLAQARLVKIGFEEGARAASRHLSLRKLRTTCGLKILVKPRLDRPG